MILAHVPPMYPLSHPKSINRAPSKHIHFGRWCIMHHPHNGDDDQRPTPFVTLSLAPLCGGCGNCGRRCVVWRRTTTGSDDGRRGPAAAATFVHDVRPLRRPMAGDNRRPTTSADGWLQWRRPSALALIR